MTDSTQLTQSLNQTALKLRHRHEEMCANHLNKPVDIEDDESILSNSDDDNRSISSDDNSDTSSCISNDESEEHNIWDNREFEMHGIDIDNLKYCKNEDQSFFALYKLRYQQIRNFLTKNLTQKQHADINIKILLIAKCLSNNTVQTIQCHNYNYFQPLKENEQFQEFNKYYKQYNSKSQNIQKQQKQEFILNLKQKNKSSFFPQTTGQKTSTIAKHTIKDFDLDCNEQNQHESPINIIKQSNIPQKSNESLSHITDTFESQQNLKQISANSSLLQQTPQRKFKITAISTSKASSRNNAVQSTNFNSKESLSSCYLQNSISKLSKEYENPSSSRLNTNKNITLDQLRNAGSNFSSINDMNDDLDIKSIQNLNDCDKQKNLKQKSISIFEQSPLSSQHFKFNSKYFSSPLKNTSIRSANSLKTKESLLPIIKQENKQKLYDINLQDSHDQTNSTTNSSSPTSKQNICFQKSDNSLNQSYCFSQKLNQLGSQSSRNHNIDYDRQNTSQSYNTDFQLGRHRNQVSLRHKRIVAQSIQSCNTLNQKPDTNQLTPEQKIYFSNSSNMQSKQIPYSQSPIKTKTGLISNKSSLCQDYFPSSKMNNQNCFFKNEYIQTNSKNQNNELIMNFKQLVQS